MTTLAHLAPSHGAPQALIGAPVQSQASRSVRAVPHVELWTAQLVLGLSSALFGLWMLAAPIAQLADSMAWAGEHAVNFVRLLGVLNLMGGLGLLVPLWVQRMPLLSVLAAAGCMVLHIAAISFHLARHDASELSVNLVLLSMALFLLWGRIGLTPPHVR